MPYSTTDLLRLGFPIRPEQVWLYEQQEDINVMIPFALEDHSHAHCCGNPMLLRDTGQGRGFPPLVVPTPARLTADSLNFDYAEDYYGPEFFEVPGLLLEPASPNALYMESHPVFIWDVAPVDDEVFDQLLAGHEALNEGLGLDFMERSSEFCSHDNCYCNTGEVRPEVEEELGEGGVDLADLEELWASDDEDLVQLANKEVSDAEDRIRERYEEDLQGFYGRHTLRNVHKLMGLDDQEVGRVWSPLRSISKQCWRRLPLTVPRQSREAYAMQFRHFNPWYDGWL